MSLIDSQYTTDIIRFGEAYVEGLWDAEPLEDHLYEMSLNKELHRMATRRIETPADPMEIHYNLGNELYRNMLGSTWCYSAARWQDGDDLDTAQGRKFANIVEKLELEPGMRILDLGCGWGAFGQYCKWERLGVNVDGVTLSTEQAKIAGRYSTVFLCDYRDFATAAPYDRVISLGMLEHVGHEHYREYFQAVDRYLKPDGIHLYEVTAHNVSHTFFNPWIRKYIFPDGMLPSLAQLSRASERLFVTEDVENFGPQYIETLRAWWANCERARNWLRL